MQNIRPNVWGSYGWKFMHYITLAYPDNPSREEQLNMKTFFKSIGSILPCNACRINFYNHIEKYPLNDTVLSSNKNLVEWLMNIHNQANISLGKPVYTLDKLYNEYLNSSNNKKTNILRYILVLRQKLCF